MSENEIKAMEYSAKCERRRARKAKRRSAVSVVWFGFRSRFLSAVC